MTKQHPAKNLSAWSEQNGYWRKYCCGTKNERNLGNTQQPDGHSPIRTGKRKEIRNGKGQNLKNNRSSWAGQRDQPEENKHIGREAKMLIKKIRFLCSPICHLVVCSETPDDWRCCLIFTGFVAAGTLHFICLFLSFIWEQGPTCKHMFLVFYPKCCLFALAHMVMGV